MSLYHIHSWRHTEVKAVLANIHMDTWPTSNPKSVSLVLLLLLPRSHPAPQGNLRAVTQSDTHNEARREWSRSSKRDESRSQRTFLHLFFRAPHAWGGGIKDGL